MNKLKTIFIAALFETALVLCVGCANLLLKPIYFFSFIMLCMVYCLAF